MRPATPRSQPFSGRELACMAALTAAAAALRFATALKPLWFDELWTLQNLVPRLPTAWSVLTARVDSNHYLSTAYLRLLRPTAWWPAYRLPSLIAGALTVPLAGVWARRFGRAESWACMALTALSYPLVHYSSEARGYAVAVLCAFAAALFWRRFVERRAFADAAAFWAAVVVGLLAHLELVYVLAAAGLAAWAVFARRGRPLPARDLLALTGPPLFALGALYLVDLRFMTHVGAPAEPLGAVARGALSLCAGGPPDGAWSWAAAGLALALATAGLLEAAQDRACAWYLGLLVFALPVASVVAFQPRYLEIRYWLIPLAFAVELEALALTRLWRRGGGRRLAAAAAAGVIAAASLWRVARLVELGRGDALAALDYMSARSTAASITVGGDNDYRDGALVSFYTPLVEPPRAVTYRPQSAWPAAGVDWVVLHSFDRSLVPPAGLRIGGVDYGYAAAFPYAGLSGWTWFVYRNAGAR